MCLGLKTKNLIVFNYKSLNMETCGWEINLRDTVFNTETEIVRANDNSIEYKHLNGCLRGS